MDKNLFNKIYDLLSNKKNIVFSYVFGSFVKSKRYKDVDIAVYLDNEELDTLELLNLKRELMDIVLVEVDVVILNKANPLIKHEIFKSGKKIFSKDKKLENSFIVHSLFEYEDMRKYYNLSYDSMINKIRNEVRING